MFQDRLYESARRHARRALDAAAAQSWHDFSADAGIAVELLAKAYLASLHDVLIIGTVNGSTDFDGLLLTLGFTHYSEKGPMHIRTITGEQAIDRAARLLLDLSPLRQEARSLLRSRNAALHLASAEADEERRATALLGRLAQELLDGMAKSAEDFWGSHLEFIQAVLNDRASELERHMAEKKAAAVRLFQARYPEGGTAPGLVAIEAMARMRASEDDETQPYNCPVCNTTGTIVGDIDLKVEPQWDTEGGEPYIDGVMELVLLRPQSFQCPACDLYITGPELAAAGIPAAIELPDVNPADYDPEAGWEPETDWEEEPY